MKTFFKQFHGQTLATVVTFFVATIMAACGGGGGSSGTITTPATGAVTKAVSCTIQANAASCGASVEYTTSGASSPKLVVGTTTMATSASGTVPVTVGNVTVPVTLYDGATVLDSSKSLTGSCVSGTTWNGSACAPVVTTWWPPAYIAPIGTKVVGMNQLPSTATTIGNTAWQQAVKDGTVKFIDTGIVLSGYSTRAVIWAFYQSIEGFSCARPIYKDDGSYVDHPETTGNCNTGVLADWAVGTQAGIIRHAPNAGCYQLTWNATRKGFDDTLVSCPF